MKRQQYGAFLYSQYVKGFSLIELMVSLTIGLLISIAAFSAYLGVAGASKVTDAQGRMNEDAQAALSILTQQIRMAQNNPIQANRTDQYRQNPVYKPDPSTTFMSSRSPSFFSIRGCDGTFDNIKTALSIDDLNYLSCASLTSPLPDSIGISYEADAFNTVPTAADPPLPTDCLGNGLTAVTATLTTTTVGAPSTDTVATYYVVDNRFYIDKSAQAIPSLYCNGNGGTAGPQPLVENIENLQLRYGLVKLSTPVQEVKTAAVVGYLTADEVSKLTTVGNDPNPWNKVIAIRVCVVVRSEGLVLTDLASARYIKCDGNIENSPVDLRMRRAYSTTVVLRNRRL